MADLDIYGRRKMEFGGAFSADDADISFSFSTTGGSLTVDKTTPGLLTQALQTMYVQQITRAYEIGTNLTYYIAGRPRGQAMLNRLVGPRALIGAFYYKFGNVCCAPSNTLSLRASANFCGAGISRGDPIGFDMSGMVLNQVALSVQSENMIFNESLTAEFIAMSLQGQQAAITCASALQSLLAGGVQGGDIANLKNTIAA